MGGAKDPVSYRELFKEENEAMFERYTLAAERIEQIIEEDSVAEPYRDYFVKTAQFIGMISRLRKELEENKHETLTREQLAEYNQRLYEDILPGAYETSYANPAFACEKLGKDYGRLLGFLYTEIRGMIVYAYESRLTDITILSELFIEIYNCFEEEQLPKAKELRKILYWFVSDYSDVTVAYRVREQLDPSLTFALDIIMNEDLSDVRYLYRFGEYISDNEIQTAEFLNSLEQEEIDAMASTYTEGYRIGFERAGKDLSIKKTVNIRYTLGFERIIRKAVMNFREMGLEPVIYRAAVNTINKRQQMKIGYYGAIANKQYEYDHKDDNALYMDKPFVERKLGVLRSSYEKYKALAKGHAGPAVVEIFGEVPFVPVTKEEAYSLNEKQQKLAVQYNNESGRMTNAYIPGEERSFTIIAYPIPEIGEQYPEIFRETVKVNTLDYRLYENIQQKLIDALDRAEYVHILGAGDNKTDLRVQLWKLKDPKKETIFENCVADVNIPVGEVFTSPMLQGTDGVLFVSGVYLNELHYKNLEIHFENGKIVDYMCDNFEKEEENRKYIKENILFHHETLPLGEFAIGTNTTAYRMAQKYDIADKLPILIAEKMGPHFAVGDTCYSWTEDMKVYNPDGKEIVARDNEVSLLRKEDVSKAYFNCHTDITIPYEELRELSAVAPDGERIPVILEGRFVLPGTEELNHPLDER